jgi:hypothetical protein
MYSAGMKPRRGAMPTPKSEVEKAERYIPEVVDGPEVKPDPPTDVERDKEA